MTSLRREPTIGRRIKCVLTKNSLFKQFFPSKQYLVNCKLISTHCQSLWKTEFFVLILRSPLILMHKLKLLLNKFTIIRAEKKHVFGHHPYFK